jgi:hypothetical protein
MICQVQYIVWSRCEGPVIIAALLPKTGLLLVYLGSESSSLFHINPHSTRESRVSVHTQTSEGYLGMFVASSKLWKWIQHMQDCEDAP